MTSRTPATGWLLLAASFVHMVSPELVEAHVRSKCKMSKPIAEHLVVVARHKEDIMWLVEEVDVPFLAYQSENASTDSHVRRHKNGALEASAYLQFLAEYYDCLPEVTAFIHAHRSSWHSEDMVNTLRQLNWSSVKSYLPLHENYFQPYGMYFRLDVADPGRNLKTILATGEEAENGSYTFGQIVNGTAYADDETYHYRQAGEILHAWQNFFEPEGLGTVPAEIQYYCCAQFLVTKDRIQRLPRQFYLQALHWATHGSWTGYFKPVYSRALVFESLWHIIFGEAAVLPKASSSELCDYFACGS